MVFQKQQLPLTTLEKIGELLSNSYIDTNIREYVGFTLEHATNNG